jgi:hypothetical protein
MIGSDAAPPPNGPNGFSDRGGISGTLAMGWGSGCVFFCVFTSVFYVSANLILGWEIANFPLDLISIVRPTSRTLSLRLKPFNGVR